MPPPSGGHCPPPRRTSPPARAGETSGWRRWGRGRGPRATGGTVAVPTQEHPRSTWRTSAPTSGRWLSSRGTVRRTRRYPRSCGHGA
eukprot:4849593-Pleurochrysis_carterae.AAC.1